VGVDPIIPADMAAALEAFDQNAEKIIIPFVGPLDSQPPDGAIFATNTTKVAVERDTTALRFGFDQIEPNTANEDCPVGNGKSTCLCHIPHPWPIRDLDIDTTQSLASIVPHRDKPKAGIIDDDPPLGTDWPSGLS
jgi:hypothetical protein